MIAAQTVTVDLDSAVETTRALLAAHGDPAKHPLTAQWVVAVRALGRGRFSAQQRSGNGAWILMEHL